MSARRRRVGKQDHRETCGPPCPEGSLQMSRKKAVATTGLDRTQDVLARLLTACLCADMVGELPEQISVSLLEEAGSVLPDCGECHATGVVPGEDPDAELPKLCKKCVGLCFEVPPPARLQVLRTKYSEAMWRLDQLSALVSTKGTIESLCTPRKRVRR